MSWENPDVIEGLRKMFHCKENEKIIAVSVSPTGLQAYFELATDNDKAVQGK